MKEDEQTHAALLAKANEMYGVKIRCTHNTVTLVQHIDPEYGWFVAYQCDDCGQLTRREVTAEQLDVADKLPWLDLDMYEHVTTERVKGEKDMRALAFMGKAAR
jgi:hypothetical protein